MTDTTQTVLVVDDDQHVAGALGRLLRRYTAMSKVLHAGTAEEAIPLLAAQPVDLVITDLRMPGLGGHGLMTHLAKNFPTLPFIATSAAGDMEDVLLALRAGAADYVQKPWTNDGFRASLERLERWHARCRDFAVQAR